MGVPPGNGVNASGQPPVNDQASAVLSGVFTAVGPSAPFAFRGPMNMLLYASLVDALATTALSLAATVNSAAELAIGTAINSKNVPPGTTIGAIAGTDVTLAPPPVTYPGILNPVTGQVTLPPGSNVAALLGATVTIPSTASPATLPVPELPTRNTFEGFTSRCTMPAAWAAASASATSAAALMH